MATKAVCRCSLSLRCHGRSQLVYAPQRFSRSRKRGNFSAESVCNVLRKEMCSLSGPTVERLEVLYDQRLHAYKNSFAHTSVDEQGIFTNSELSLKYIDTYGFDYDYTLACYTSELPKLLYDLCKERLVKEHRYPKEIMSFEYDPNFAIRGLHFDLQKGLSLKIDGYQHIEFGTVYRGHCKVSDEEVIELYGGTHVPLHIMNDFYGHAQAGGSLQHYLDMFSQPELTLLADVIEYLLVQHKPFNPKYAADDCKTAMAEVHRSGDMHSAIMADVSRYLKKDSRVDELLKRLKEHGKNIFLITNSPFSFVDKGMSYIVDEGWKDLFDLIIVRARKPSFFMNFHHPFRSLDTRDSTPSWDKVTELKKGTVYTEGNVQDFMKLTGWNGTQVLYFGDHVYTDLADPIQKFGWNTGAIVPELEREITRGNEEEFKAMLSELLTVDSLLRVYQSYDSSEVKLLIERWKERRNVLREEMKAFYNPRFGSMFRTRRGSSYFTRRLIRLANIYTSNVTNLLNYPLDYAFYSKRFALPHEAATSFDVKSTPI